MQPNAAKTLFGSFKEYRTAYHQVVQAIVGAVPSVAEKTVLWGTGPVSAIHMAHRVSWDIDLMGKEPMVSQAPLAKKLRKAFGSDIRLIGDDDIGIYQGKLALPGLPEVSLDLLPCWEHFRAADLENYRTLGMQGASLTGYAAVKAKSIWDRDEFKDIYDLAAVHAFRGGADIAERAIFRHCDLIGISKVAVLAGRGRNLENSGLGDQPVGFRPVTQASMADFAAGSLEILARKKEIDRVRREDRRLERVDAAFAAPGFSM